MSETARIGYQGVKGSYSYRACAQYFPGGNYRGFRTFFDAVQAVNDGTVDYAMIPVENSTAGRVMEVYNLLPESNLHIIGEYMLPIHHCLLIPRRAFRGAPEEGMSVDDIVAWKESPLSAQEMAAAFGEVREVHSHPQALAQCARFLQKKLPLAAAKSLDDTAGAARGIINRTNAEIAAIASKEAAEIYDMEVLAENIEDVPDNTTRFLILAREALPPESVAAPALTTLLFEIRHEPGSLFRALRVFEKHGINMTKLETYMSGRGGRHPAFYVDIGVNLLAPRWKTALDEFKQETETLRVMGAYPASPDRGSSFLAVA